MSGYIDQDTVDHLIDGILKMTNRTSIQDDSIIGAIMFYVGNGKKYQRGE